MGASLQSLVAQADGGSVGQTRSSYFLQLLPPGAESGGGVTMTVAELTPTGGADATLMDGRLQQPGCQGHK